MSKEKITIGKVTGAVGLRGEIRIFHNADDPEQMKSYETISIDGTEYEILSVRHKKKIPIIKLSGVNDRNTAEALMGKEIFIDGEDLPELPDDSYYIKDLVGLNVLSADGEKIGVLTEVISGTAQDVYEIELTDKRKMLVPAVSDFIVEINVDEGKIVVNPPDGVEDIIY